MQLSSSATNVDLPADLAINAEVDLNQGEGGYFLAARLNINLPGVDGEV